MFNEQYLQCQVLTWLNPHCSWQQLFHLEWRNCVTQYYLRCHVRIFLGREAKLSLWTVLLLMQIDCKSAQGQLKLSITFCHWNKPHKRMPSTKQNDIWILSTGQGCHNVAEYIPMWVCGSDVTLTGFWHFLFNHDLLNKPRSGDFCMKSSIISYDLRLGSNNSLS